jgi:radical SAM protein with 4Fe4S-binding SPASM domain
MLRYGRFRYLKYINLNRVVNFVALYLSYYLSRWLSKSLIWGRPLSISIEPTTSCNLRCPQCPSGLRSFTRDTGMLEQETNRRIIDQLSPQLAYITYYFQGEPYLNPDFLDMVKYATSKNIYTTTSSNAHYLTPENCHRTVESGLGTLIISLDGITQESYSKYRIGGNLDKVLEGTRNIMQAKKASGAAHPYVIWQFIVFSHNENELDELKKLAVEYKIDELKIKTAQIYDFENGHHLMPKDEKYSRYVLDKNGYRIRNKLLNHCWRMWQGCVFTWDGDVVPCCFDKDAKHKMGNIMQQTFSEIWKNTDYQSFRHQLSQNRQQIDICSNCTEGTQVWK